MKEKEMENIAELFKKCLKDGVSVKNEVRALRKAFQKVHYSFDR
jgi:glycine/serine hydroxymethyltransferase